jgi:membrane protein HdeD
VAEPQPLERRRTGWDVVLGILSVVAGVVTLGHVALASAISVLFLGWTILFGGVALAVSALVGWKDPGRRWDLAFGALLFLVGLGFVRNPGVGLLTLTLLAGSLLLVGGVVRIVAAFQPGAPRALLLLSGAVTLLLGFMVLNQWPVSALWFLGTVLGIELILGGITTAISGRLRPVTPVTPVTLDTLDTRSPEPEPPVPA